jgi:hypothetical protein
VSEELEPYPDVEALLVALLSPLAPTYTVTPADFTRPIIQAVRTGGTDDGITDHPRCEVTVYGDTRAAAWKLALKAQQTVLATPGTAVDGVYIDDAATAAGDHEIHRAAQDTRQVSGSYRIDLRRPQR